MNPVLRDLRRDPLGSLLAFVPVVLAAEHVKPGAHAAMFLLSIVAFRADRPGGAPWT